MTETTALHAFVEEQIRADALLDEWDNPPALWLAFQKENEEPYIVDLQVPDYVFAGLGKSWQAVELMALAIEQGYNPPFPPQAYAGDPLLALIVRDEGWRLDSKTSGLTQEDLDQWLREGKPFREHPAAKEMKMYTAFLTDGSAVTAVQSRGEEPEVWDDHALDGAGPDAARHFLKAWTNRHSE